MTTIQEHIAAIRAFLDDLTIYAGPYPQINRTPIVSRAYELQGSLSAIETACKRASKSTSSEWQPIDTAPKDGTVFDVWLGDADLEDVEFYCTDGTRRSCGWWWFQGKLRPKSGLAHCLCFVEPTHWMPLPQPPKKGTDHEL